MPNGYINNFGLSAWLNGSSHADGRCGGDGGKNIGVGVPKTMGFLSPFLVRRGARQAHALAVRVDDRAVLAEERPVLLC